MKNLRQTVNDFALVVAEVVKTFFCAEKETKLLGTSIELLQRFWDGRDRVTSPLLRAGEVERSEGEGSCVGFARAPTGPSPAAETATSPASGKRWSASRELHNHIDRAVKSHSNSIDAPTSSATRSKLLFSLLAFACPIWGCSGSTTRTDLDYSYGVLQTVEVAELSDLELVQFESVFWEPDDSVSLRKLIAEDEIANGRRVLEIGTGTGLLSLMCLRYGASHVVATDINPAAAANARYNAAAIELDENLEVRLVKLESSGAFAVIDDSERFDLIITNPPWEDGEINQPSDHAFYDPQFALMDSLLADLPKHLNPGGRCLLAYGHKPAITRLLSKAKEMKYQVKVLDDRKLEDLEQDFLPGMLVELRLDRNHVGKVDGATGTFTSPPE